MNGRVHAKVETKIYAQVMRCGCGDPLSHEGVPCYSPIWGEKRLVDYQNSNSLKQVWGLYKHGLLWSKVRRKATKWLQTHW